MKREKDIFFFTNILAPYNILFYEKLSKKLNSRIKYFFDAAREPNRKWNVNYEQFNFEFELKKSLNFKINSKVNNDTRLDRIIYLPFWIFKEILISRPKIIISSEFGLRTIFSWLAGSFIRAGVYVISDVTHHSERKISFLQRVTRKFLARRLNGGIAKSKKAMEYLLSLGFPKNKLTVSPYAVDNAFYNSEAQKFNKRELRLKYGFAADELILLYSGQFIHRKGIDLLTNNVSLFNKFSDKRIKVIFSGGTDAELKKIAPEFNSKVFVNAGFLDQKTLTEYFILADYLILPTRLDTWGIVVNESLASGCPVLLSKYAGAADELVQNHKNGIIFDPLDDQEFQSILKKAVDSTICYATEREKIMNSVLPFNYEKAADVVRHFLNSELSNNSEEE